VPVFIDRQPVNAAVEHRVGPTGCNPWALPGDMIHLAIPPIPQLESLIKGRQTQTTHFVYNYHISHSFYITNGLHALVNWLTVVIKAVHFFRLCSKNTPDLQFALERLQANNVRQICIDGVIHLLNEFRKTFESENTFDVKRRIDFLARFKARRTYKFLSDR
jgi:hypothetical protein